MRATPLTLLAALLATAGVASACSLASEPPGPGAFTLWRDGANETLVPVDGRMLGAGCELSNPHVVVGDTFAWVEMAMMAAGEPRDAHVLDLETGEARVVRGFTRGSLDAFGVWNDHIAYWAWTPTGDDWRRRANEFALVDIETGTRRALPFPDAAYTQAAVGGGIVAAVARADDGAGSVWAYDLAREAWLLQGVPGESLVGTPHVHVAAASDAWLLLGAREGFVAYALATGETRDVPLQPGRWTLEGDWAYNAHARLRYHLPSGESEPLAVPEGEVLSYQGGRAVLGRYSAPEAATIEESRGEPEDAPAAADSLLPRLAGGGLAIAIVAGSALFAWRRGA